mmetsp:Transcript_69014/g.225001  ORF Transcript_69014/g.225001 Transcript_69014/m.225001 type:complete len:202 (-) Transcript_69014:1665-2270(-)
MRLNLPRRSSLNFTPGKNCSAMYIAVLKCNDSSPQSKYDVPSANEAGSMSWSARCSSTAAPVSKCPCTAAAASPAAAAQRSGTLPTLPPAFPLPPRLLPNPGRSLGSVPPWKRAPEVVSTTMSTQNLPLTPFSTMHLTCAPGKSARSCARTASRAGCSSAPRGDVTWSTASMREGSPCTDKSMGRNGSLRPGVVKRTWPPP